MRHLLNDLATERRLAATLFLSVLSALSWQAVRFQVDCEPCHTCFRCDVERLVGQR
ncbi:MAG: hypothetical protein JKY65_12620 [Planctomycetes bacterium]|nr:hypothetical protein [Planctomycetota bacterium]